MKIIDIAICVDNIDPKGIGRIRCIRYNDYVGEKEKALNYVKWDDLDPFIASPFLPNNINIIPEIGQSVKIINYNTEKETVNQEYIAGPFTTMYDYNSQNFSKQIENTTYGVAVKRTAAIRKSTGDYIEKNSEYVFAKEKDFGIYGKYGSDILFTEDGIELRGGKLLSKIGASVNNRKKLVSTPIYSNKNAKLHLKKFSKTGNLTENREEFESVENPDLNYVIEYEIDTLNTTSLISFFVYKITNSFNDNYKINSFDDNTVLVNNDEVQTIKLINETLNTTGATFTVPFNVTSDKTDDAKKIASIIRDVLYQIHQKTLNSLNSLYTNEDVHPFYFRASDKFKSFSGTTEELEFKNNILNNIELRDVGPSNGLIWSIASPNQKPTIRENVEQVFKIDENSGEQTFGSLMSDKIFLLSTNTNEIEKKINFDELDKYELTQKNYIQDIEPNTYSVVRGEELIEVLKIMRDLIVSHRHNLMGPLVQKDPNFAKLQERIDNLENSILNRSIRIN